MNTQQKFWLQLSAGAILLAVIAGLGWQKFGTSTREEGILSGNGRIEGVEIDIAAKAAGRLKDILVKEGKFMTLHTKSIL